MAGYIVGRLLGIPEYRDKTIAVVLTAQETIYKTILVLLTFTAILWMSIFFYATFYYMHMPAISHIRPIHLQYSSCGKEHGLCTFPGANVTLTKRHKILMTGQPYRILVELEMPESLTNQQTGMFMVCAELKDADYNLVDKSCRSAILHYKSFFHHAIATFVYAPFLLSGSAEEKQIVPVELFSGFQEDANRPATQAFIQIQSQHVEIYQAYLKIHAHFTGLRYFMFHWPILSGIIGIISNFFFLSIVAFLSWYKFFISKQQVLQVGYDADAARELEERRVATKGRLQREQEERSKLRQIAEDDQQRLQDETDKKRTLSESSEKSKLEEPENKSYDKSKLEEPENENYRKIKLEEQKYDSYDQNKLEEQKYDSYDQNKLEEQKYDSYDQNKLEEQKYDSYDQNKLDEQKSKSSEDNFEEAQEFQIGLSLSNSEKANENNPKNEDRRSSDEFEILSEPEPGDSSVDDDDKENQTKKVAQTEPEGESTTLRQRKT